MTTETINPLDNIILTNAVIATLIYISDNRKIKSSKTVLLPGGTQLISAEINYKPNDEYWFYFKDITQYDSFKNLYMSREINDISIVGFRINIKFHNLFNRFEIAEKFDYGHLNPSNPKHVMLVTVIFLREGLNVLDTSKWILFINNFVELTTLKQCYSERLITYNETKNQMFKKISEQIKIRNN